MNYNFIPKLNYLIIYSNLMQSRALVKYDIDITLNNFFKWLH